MRSYTWINWLIVVYFWFMTRTTWHTALILDQMMATDRAFSAALVAGLLYTNSKCCDKDSSGMRLLTRLFTRGKTAKNIDVDLRVMCLSLCQDFALPPRRKWNITLVSVAADVMSWVRNTCRLWSKSFPNRGRYLIKHVGISSPKDSVSWGHHRVSKSAQGGRGVPSTVIQILCIVTMVTKVNPTHNVSLTNHFFPIKTMISA